MHFEKRREITDFGYIDYYHDQNISFALYMYNDDNETVYLSNIYVPEEFRNHGYGNEILNYVKEVSSNKTIILRVLKESWMHGWYERNGYDDLCDFEEDDNFIWMINI